MRVLIFTILNRKKNVEDPFVSFLHRMLNTGYTSSKISRNRIEKASEKRKRIAEKVEEFLAQLPSYRQEIPVVNRRPYLIRKRY
ncbi:hypothetical protein ABEB36_007894 [Hypothenemus hampei]|uniref:Uncharacterized protein n=1 Tax=Hypothenemus hampei TaxID=57062 RepID=A0ABD1EVH1_HYPHA